MDGTDGPECLRGLINRAVDNGGSGGLQPLHIPSKGQIMPRAMLPLLASPPGFENLTTALIKNDLDRNVQYNTYDCLIGSFDF